MARAELRIDFSGLENLTKRMENPALAAELRKVPAMKEIAALVAQEIADNFAKEGPGWAPLKGATIRNSIGQNKATNRLINDAEMHAAQKLKAIKVSKSGKRSINKSELAGRRAEFNRHVDKYLEEVEAAARKPRPENVPGIDNEPLGNRQILVRTGLLRNSVTQIGSPSNINRVEGTNLIWGTNLVYAGVHNNGAPERNIPQREFLVIRDEWQARLVRFVFQLMSGIVKKYVEGK